MSNGGLKFYQYDEDEPEWRTWRTWPHLQVSMDQGPDGIAALFWLWHKDCSISVSWDPSHGAQNDWKNLLKTLGLMEFWLLMMITWNSPSGPLRDATRHGELSETWKACFEDSSPSTNVLFQSLLHQIVDDRGGVSHFSSEEPLETQVWELIKDSPPCRGPVGKCNLNRFFLHPPAHALLNLTFLALESGWLSTRRVEKLVMRKDTDMGDGEQVGRASTDARRLQYSDKALISMAHNAVVVGVHMLSSDEHKQYIHIILEAGEETEVWQGRHNKECRSTESCREWMIAQLGGEFLGHLRNTLDRLARVMSLQRCGLSLGALPEDPSDDGLPLIREGDMTTLLSHAIVVLAGKRLARCLSAFRGWPSAFAGLLGWDALRASTISMFREDQQAYEAFANAPGRTKAMQSVIDRSFFHHRSVKQYIAAQFVSLGCVWLSARQSRGRRAPGFSEFASSSVLLFGPQLTGWITPILGGRVAPYTG